MPRPRGSKYVLPIASLVERSGELASEVLSLMHYMFEMVCNVICENIIVGYYLTLCNSNFLTLLLPYFAISHSSTMYCIYIYILRDRIDGGSGNPPGDSLSD